MMRRLCGILALLTLSTLPLSTATATAAGRGQAVAAASPCATVPDAWVCARKLLPHDVPVLRPTWLPSRFRQPPVLQGVNYTRGSMAYQISYYTSRGDLLVFVLGPANSWRPKTIEHVRVRGVAGELITASGTWFTMQITWRQGVWPFTVQARGVSRGDLLHIVNTLSAMKPLTHH